MSYVYRNYCICVLYRCRTCKFITTMRDVTKNHIRAIVGFIENNYSCEEILSNFKLDFLESVIEKDIESWLDEDEYFLVRDIPD